PSPRTLEPAGAACPVTRRGRAEPVGGLAVPRLRTPRQRAAAVLAPPPRTAVGTLRAAPALAGCLRPRAERLRGDRVAPRLGRRPRPPPGLGGRLGHPDRS